MKKLLLISALSLTTSLFALENSILPYGGQVKFDSKSVKDKGNFGGFYAKFLANGYKSELGYERISISYDDKTRKDLTQNDYTLIVTKYIGANYLVKAGMHYVDSSDITTDKTKTYILGVSRYELYKNDYGINLYYSSYGESSPSYNVTQISPFYGINFGDYKSLLGSFYLKVTANYINLGDKPNFSSKKSFTLALNNYNGKLTTTIEGTIGKEVNAVKNGGFTLYNNSNI